MDFKNVATIIGYVNGFKLTPYKNGNGAVANIGIKDEKNGCIHFISMFTNKNKKFKYNDVEYDPSALKSVFIDENGEPRHILVNAFCGIALNKYVNSQGVEVSNTQILCRKISSFSDVDAQKATFDVRGYVESFSQSGDEFKLKVAVLTKDSKDNINGISHVVLCTDESIVEDAMDSIAKGNYAKFRGRIINKVIYDDLGDRAGTLKKNNVLKISDLKEKDDIPEGDAIIYKLAKNLGKGQYVDKTTLKIKTYGESSEPVVSDDEDIDIDFD